MLTNTTEEVSERNKFSLSGLNLTISNISIRDEGEYFATKTGEFGQVMGRCRFDLKVTGKQKHSEISNHRKYSVMLNMYEYVSCVSNIL